MSYGFNNVNPYMGAQGLVPNINNQMNGQMPTSSQQQFQQSQQAQQMFIQPIGNVYSINNTLEAANVPAGADQTIQIIADTALTIDAANILIKEINSK